MLRDRVSPEFEAIGAVLLEDSPCCGDRLAEPPVRALEVGAIEPPGDPHRAARQQREASVLGLLHQLELFLPPRAVGS